LGGERTYRPISVDRTAPCSARAAEEAAGEPVLANITRDCREIGGARPKRVFSGSYSRRGGGNVAWIVKLVSLGAEGEEHSTEVMRIARPDDLTDLAGLGLTLAEGKRRSCPAAWCSSADPR
jgi:hypothetical protein